MNVLIDGKEITCKTIELIEEDLIIGCHCAGGYHQEVNGSSVITIDIDSGELTAKMLDTEGGVDYTANIPLPEMFEDIGKAVLRFRYKDDEADEALKETLDYLF